MNWQSKTTSEVQKEKIWAELVKKEHRDLKIFDSFRSSAVNTATASTGTSRLPTAAVSERDKRFLDKAKMLYESAIQAALPELRHQSSAHGPYALPFRNVQYRVSMASSLSSSNASPPLSSSPFSLTTTLAQKDQDETKRVGGRPPRSISNTSTHGESDKSSRTSPIAHHSSSFPLPCRSSTPSLATADRHDQSSTVRFRPTSASEIGCMLEPLVRHRVGAFRYGIPNTDIRTQGASL